MRTQEYFMDHEALEYAIASGRVDDWGEFPNMMLTTEQEELIDDGKAVLQGLVFLKRFATLDEILTLHVETHAQFIREPENPQFGNRHFHLRRRLRHQQKTINYLQWKENQ